MHCSEGTIVDGWRGKWNLVGSSQLPVLGSQGNRFRATESWDHRERLLGAEGALTYTGKFF